VAAVNQLPGIFEQIRLVAALRWRLLRNALRRKNNRLDLLGLLLSGIFSSLLVLGLCFAFFAGAYSFLSRGRLGWMALLYWGIFIWWQIFPLFVAGFGASFEFRTLLRFPLSRPAFYVIGLAYGLADFSALAGLCWLVSITVGAAAAQPQVVPAVLLVNLVFVLMNVNLERLIGSWLERLLARRRTREIFFALFILSMVSLQFVSPLVERYGDAALPWARLALPYLAPFPGSLAGRAVAGAAGNRYGDFFVGLAGLSLYVLLFAGLLWLRFAAQYRGEELSEAPAPARAPARPATSDAGDSTALRLLSPQVAEVFRKEFRYLLRNGFSFFLVVMPPLFVLLFTSQAGALRHQNSGVDFPQASLFPAIMGYLVLILMAPAYNSFAYEGRGIQTYFMAPIRFRQVFLGKNLMMICLLAFELVLSVAFFAYRVGLPPAPRFVATLAAIVFSVAGQLPIANWSALNFPRKLTFGQMRGQRQSGMAVLTLFGVQIVLGGIGTVILFSGRWTGNPWLPAEAFAALAAAALAGYFASLDALSEFAEKKKESLLEALCR
jgi:ABC-2 type transport system permease protein